MNNYYTLIYLIHELKETLIGSQFDVALSNRRNLLELYFEQDDQKFRLIFSTNPQNAALFLDRFQIPKKQNTAIFFDELQSLSLKDIILAEADRFISFEFESNFKLTFLLYSNHANAILSKNGLISEAYKKEKSLLGKLTPKPVPAFAVQPKEVRKINDIISIVDPLLPRNTVRELLRDIDIIEHSEQAVLKVQELQKSLTSQAYPHFSDEFGFSIANPALLGLSDVKDFGTVSEAIAYSFFKWIRFSDFESKKKQVLDRIRKAISRTHLAISELEAVGDASEKSALFEKYGHLLMASPNAETISGKIKVNDYYSDGSEITINVDATKNVVENATVFYEKAKNVKRVAETYAKRLIDFNNKVRELEKLSIDLEQIGFGRDLEKWLKSNDTVLKRIGYAEADSIQVAQHFRSYHKNNYEIRVGKSATSNDELLRISRKDDLWMHARGVAGSHVVIPMNKSLYLPPKEVMEYAAGLAAFFSKAKGSSLVPVIFTRKKFVRKSKGMPPGAVLVDKEEVLLVPPQKPDELNAEE